MQKRLRDTGLGHLLAPDQQGRERYMERLVEGSSEAIDFEPYVWCLASLVSAVCEMFGAPWLTLRYAQPGKDVCPLCILSPQTMMTFMVTAARHQADALGVANPLHPIG